MPLCFIATGLKTEHCCPHIVFQVDATVHILSGKFRCTGFTLAAGGTNAVINAAGVS